MPHYQLPPVPAEKEPALNVASSPDDWSRRITIPVNKEILAALEVDGEAVITLRGKITGLSSSESVEHSSTSVTITIDSVDAYPDKGVIQGMGGDMDEDDAFSGSFNKARGMFPGKRY
jgi:hypothetical protein